MSLDVPPPEPPRLEPSGDTSDTGDVDEYRRSELDSFLRNGAWHDAWERWSTETALEEAEYDIVRDLDLLSKFDFFWDDFAGRVGYDAPGIPEDWRERDYHPDLDSWETVSSINASLTELGQVVAETLKQEYVDWESDFEAPDDLPDLDE